MLVLITILTSLTTIAAYAGEDGNKQKAEDDSLAGIADCDRNDIEEARFLCFAIAANDIEIEQPEEPPEEETATLSVCKERGVPSLSFDADDFRFTVTGNNPSPAQFFGDNSDGCVDVTIGPGEYTITEENVFGGGSLVSISIEGDCEQDPTNPRIATGEIQAGETQECTFINEISD
jgi:hypothetical protein